MDTTGTPNNEMTVIPKREDQVEVPVHESVSTSLEAPALIIGIAQETTTTTEQSLLQAHAAPITEQHQLVEANVEETGIAVPTNHLTAPEVPTDVDTSAMIAEAAAAAVFAVGDVQLAVDAALAADENNTGDDAAAAVAAVAAASVKTEAMNVADVAAAHLNAIDAETKKNEQRRKRYREKSVEEEPPPPCKKLTGDNHVDQLAIRRKKDRERYANMTPDQRQVYNCKRREQYHRQSEASRQRRRERERERYHSLENDDAKHRNARRAKLERERYQRLNPDQLENKNRKRRERAAAARNKKSHDRNATDNNSTTATTTEPIPMSPSENSIPNAATAVAAGIGAASVTAVETPAGSVAKVEQPQQQHVIESVAMDAAAVAAAAAAEVEKHGNNATDQAAVEAAVEAVDNQNHISV